MDFLGRRAGETEDAILSLYGALQVCSRSGPTLVLLDNIDYLFINSNNNNNHGGGDDDDDDDDANSRRLGNLHLVVRTQATFKEVMELLRRDSERHFHSPPSPVATRFPVLILCTARRNVEDSASALFDRVFFLESPNELQRRHMIMQYLGIADSSLDTDCDETEETDRLLLSLSQATIGKSYSELAQCCRLAIHQMALSAPSSLLHISREEESYQQQHGQPPSISTVLRILQEQLHRKTPESLRSSVTHDMFDMCVWTAQDLQSNNKSSSDNTPSSGSTFGLEAKELEEFNLMLHGPSIKAAWKQLQHSIVIPLCQRRTLAELLDCRGTTSPKVLAGGLVLTGVSGTGKSAIAFETARYAAQLLPSIKLLDVSCTSLIHKEVGGSERAIHQLFVAARKATPCILLLDGIDNIAAVRGNDATTEGTMDRVLSTLLVELDGVDDDGDALGSVEPNQGIAVIGITHNVNLIDPALLRPGRLAKVVELTLPDKDTRQLIVRRELERIKTPYVVVNDNDDNESNQDDNDESDTTTGTAAVTSSIVQATAGMAASSVVAICHDLKLWLARNTSDDGLNNNNHEVDDTSKFQVRRETIESLIRSRK
jgi:SpoVK/Ycf46/Vps4 family AAA+-type ATPase